MTARPMPQPKPKGQPWNWPARFWAKVDGGEDWNHERCWLWRASRARDGYGHIRLEGRFRMAHRLAYEFLRDQVPEGMQLDHTCRVKRCVNPWHCEIVTAAENCRRRSRHVRLDRAAA